MLPIKQLFFQHVAQTSYTPIAIEDSLQLNVFDNLLGH